MRALEAPAGCLQYLNKERGVISTFNYGDNHAIAPNQRYSICLRYCAFSSCLRAPYQRFGFQV